ncbi:MAG: hypothetical protein ACI4CC_01555 [Lachnospiraceae bacterium]
MYYQVTLNDKLYYKGRSVEHAIARGFRLRAQPENPAMVHTERIPTLLLFFDPEIGADVFKKVKNNAKSQRCIGRPSSGTENRQANAEGNRA